MEEERSSAGFGLEQERSDAGFGLESERRGGGFEMEEERSGGTGEERRWFKRRRAALVLEVFFCCFAYFGSKFDHVLYLTSKM